LNAILGTNYIGKVFCVVLVDKESMILEKFDSLIKTLYA